MTTNQLSSIPALDGWVSLTDAAEILGISYKYAYEMATRANEHRHGGWQTLRRISAEPKYVVSEDEIQKRIQLRLEGEHVAKRVNLNPDQAGIFYPSFRIINAHSWWLAATLVRKYPHLIILETHPGGGTYDCLMIVDGRDVANSPRIANLNRVGNIHITARSEPHQTTNLTWAECLSDANPYLAVDHIAFHSELHKDPTSEGPLPPRALAYEFIATVLQMHQNSPDEWDARNEFIDTSGMDTGWKKDDDLRGYLNYFPEATERPLSGERSPLEATPRIGTYREPYDHFWAILRAKEPILLVSIEGLIYTQKGTFKLTEVAVKITGGMNALAEQLLFRSNPCLDIVNRATI